MRAAKATFKLGISFENWGGLGDRYMHAFGTIGRSTWMGDFQHFWLAAQEEGFGGELGDYCFERQAASGRKIRDLGERQDQLCVPLRCRAVRRLSAAKLSEAKGVKRIEGKIARVEQHPETGCVTALGARVRRIRARATCSWTAPGSADCSSSRRSRRDSRTTAPGCAPIARSPCRRLPARRSRRTRALSRARRAGSGESRCSIAWATAWCSAASYQREDEARATLVSQPRGRAAVRTAAAQVQGGPATKAWDKNVVSMGLASGFIEPLESTSIHLIQIGVTRLMQLFPFSGITQALINRYNDQSRSNTSASATSSSFTTRSPSAKTRRSGATAATWRFRTRSRSASSCSGKAARPTRPPDEMFRVESWMQVMLGQRLRPRGYHHMGRMLGPERLRKALDTLKGSIAGAVAKMPAHRQFLESYCGTPGN